MATWLAGLIRQCLSRDHERDSLDLGQHFIRIGPSTQCTFFWKCSRSSRRTFAIICARGYNVTQCCMVPNIHIYIYKYDSVNCMYERHFIAKPRSLSLVLSLPLPFITISIAQQNHTRTSLTARAPDPHNVSSSSSSSNCLSKTAPIQRQRQRKPIQQP